MVWVVTKMTPNLLKYSETVQFLEPCTLHKHHLLLANQLRRKSVLSHSVKSTVSLNIIQAENFPPPSKRHLNIANSIYMEYKSWAALWAHVRLLLSLKDILLQHFPAFLLTAGSAKKEMANTEKQDAIVFPIHVCGTLSPYPMVVTVTFRENVKKLIQETQFRLFQTKCWHLGSTTWHLRAIINQIWVMIAACEVSATTSTSPPKSVKGHQTW